MESWVQSWQPRTTASCDFCQVIRSAAPVMQNHLSKISKPTFRPSGTTNHWKNTVFRDFPTFSRICSFFFWLFLFCHLLSSSLLSSTLLFSHLCFSSVHMVGSLTSKLPSIMATSELTLILIYISYNIYTYLIYIYMFLIYTLRFLKTVAYLFDEGQCWNVHGTYSALMLLLG